MNEPEYLEIQRFESAELAEEFAEVLRSANILTKVGQVRAFFNLAGVGSRGQRQETPLMVPRESFQKALEVLKADALKLPIPDDHFLADPSEEELMEVLVNTDQWSPFDLAHAERLAAERNIDLSQLDEARQKAHQESTKPKTPSYWQLSAAIVLSALGWFFGPLTGLMGLGFGWSYLTMKQKAPNDGYYFYTPKVRFLGGLLVLINLYTCIVSILFLIR